MALIADYLDYDTAKVYDQGKTKTCVPHAFFTLLSEHIQQDEGLEVEFDFYKYFDQMEAERDGMLRVRWLCHTAREKGFLTKDGQRVKIDKYVRYNAFRSFEFLCRTIQVAGPMLFAVRRYTGHKLAPKDTDVIEMPTESQLKKKKKAGHLMMIRGFDYKNQWLKIQNSWGKGDSVRWMPYDVLLKITKYMYYVKGVSIK